MNEKEIKAIERIKELISKSKFIEDIEINKQVAFKDIEIILNLIEKQQKEIEELNEIKQQICKEELITQDYVQENFIKKDKIRAKIKSNSISKDKIMEIAKEYIEDETIDLHGFYMKVMRLLEE